jgi:uncharacterized protein YndB with AHSA1/START domain
MADSNVSRDAVVIERSFDAPVDLIWRMWTEPEHFKAWYGPDGATVPVAKMDVRPGGSRLVCLEMDTPGGLVQMWFTGEYREVAENQRLVYTESGNDRGHRRTRRPRRPHENGADPHRYSCRLPGCCRVGDGAQQACRPHRSTGHPVAPVSSYAVRGSRWEYALNVVTGPITDLP